MAIDWLAAYAAGVSTILASQQIVRELPSVKIRVSRDSSIIRHGLPSRASDKRDHRQRGAQAGDD